MTFFDMLKYANTGQAAPEMTYFDQLKARAMVKGARYSRNPATGDQSAGEDAARDQSAARIPRRK